MPRTAIYNPSLEDGNRDMQSFARKYVEAVEDDCSCSNCTNQTERVSASENLSIDSLSCKRHSPTTWKTVQSKCQILNLNECPRRGSVDGNGRAPEDSVRSPLTARSITVQSPPERLQAQQDLKSYIKGWPDADVPVLVRRKDIENLSQQERIAVYSFALSEMKQYRTGLAEWVACHPVSAPTAFHRLHYPKDSQGRQLYSPDSASVSISSTSPSYRISENFAPSHAPTASESPRPSLDPRPSQDYSVSIEARSSYESRPSQDAFGFLDPQVIASRRPSCSSSASPWTRADFCGDDSSLYEKYIKSKKRSLKARISSIFSAPLRPTWKKEEEDECENEKENPTAQAQAPTLHPGPSTHIEEPSANAPVESPSENKDKDFLGDVLPSLELESLASFINTISKDES
ncbi:uncharacterized protein VTP21DRAFT_4361 [Calcarisporiella thermophila]|uniref:uncharacterized protein n=1 Tax=Calcarisporiella thermophila TaxID=911321 RepID=UPI003742C8F0